MSKMKRSVVMIVFALGMLVSSVSAADDAAEWPWWQGPNHDGKSLDTGLLKEWPAEGPKLLWQVNDIGKGFSTVAVSGGLIYTTGKNGKTESVYAIELTGKKKWQRQSGRVWKGSFPGRGSTVFR